MTNSKATEIEFDYSTRFYTNRGHETRRVLVDVGEYPRVRVWDNNGKNFTTFHSLSPAQERRIIAKARRVST